MGRTQRGNNNAYCQDSEISWVDWTLNKPQQALLTFTRSLIALRQKHPVFPAPPVLPGPPYPRGGSQRSLLAAARRKRDDG
jgi:glycogen operon protein